jgi:RNA polymerase sigma-70 factor (ECF subfamily)
VSPPAAAAAAPAAAAPAAAAPAAGAAPRAEGGFELGDEAIAQIEPVLMGFAYRAVRDRELARDLVQETFVAALEARSSFAGRSALRTWMVGILSRKIIDHYRKTRREVLTDATPEPGADDLLAPAPPGAPDRRIDPGKAMRVVERTLGSLTELERMAVLLVDVEGMARDEAGNAMGVQPTHLRVLLHRGRHKLRKALEAAGH